MVGIQRVHASYLLKHKQMDPNNRAYVEQKLLLYGKIYKIYFTEMRMVISPKKQILTGTKLTLIKA